MKIGGLQKTSLQDFPEEVSSIIWTIGCNFSCPFCYNKNLVDGNIDEITEDELFSFLEKRKKLLDGFVISGGEPFLQKDLKDFCKKVKKMGYKIKIDTNGTYPDKLKELIDEKLVDYIAMDIKAPKKKYDKLSGVKTDIKKIEKSIEIIKNSKIDYEFKTTFIPEFLVKKDILEIAKWLEGSKRYYLQQFKSDAPLISSKLQNAEPYSEEELIETLNDIKPYFKNCEVRGI
jgi:pyruvate formate lyase activating enzyme